MSEKGRPTHQSPLEERLINLIKLKGPITVADYMTDALGHPHDGYYMSREAIGAEGDFITAPEVSQIFGELIGLWLVETWRAMGSPKDFNLIELGPGRGVLMADVLRAARLRPEFVRAANVWLVETSGRLRHEQKKQLRTSEKKPNWADKFEDIPPGPSLIIANEFFDCLPIRQFQRVGLAWRERLVGLDDTGAKLQFVLGATPPPPEFGLTQSSNAEDGDIFEVCLAASEAVAELCEHLKEHVGAALIIDYGHMHAGHGDTLQAVREHKYWPPLEAPGDADITAHVDFAALASSAVDCGAAVYGPLAQGAFLERLGLGMRVEALCKAKSPEKIAEIQTGAYRLVAPDQMGEIFKAMCIASPNLAPPAGFDVP